MQQINQEAPATVNAMCDHYEVYAAQYYRKPTLDGGSRPTSHAQVIHYALRSLRDVAGHKPPDDVRAEDLYACQQWMIDHGHCRNAINRATRTIRTCFRWSARPPRRWLNASVVHDLQLVEALKYGRSYAKESERVKPVPDELVEAVLPHLPHVVATMVRVQRLTGMRPGEVCIARSCDIDCSEKVWSYRPAEHKLQHHGIDRVVPIGPKAQVMLTPFIMDRGPEDFLFSPSESMQEHWEQRNAERRTALSCGNRAGTNRVAAPRKVPGKRYDTNSYSRAVRYGCEEAFPPPSHLARRQVAARGRKAGSLRNETWGEWRDRLKAAGLLEELQQWQRDHRFALNQLRHSAATQIARENGLEAARAVLGHRTVDMTLVYAEADATAAAATMIAIG